FPFVTFDDQADETAHNPINLCHPGPFGSDMRQVSIEEKAWFLAAYRWVTVDLSVMLSKFCPQRAARFQVGGNIGADRYVRAHLQGRSAVRDREVDHRPLGHDPQRVPQRTR